MPPESNGATRQTLAATLQRARSSIWGHRVAVALERGLILGARTVLAVAIGALLLALFAWSLALPDAHPTVLGTLVWMGLAAGVTVVLRVLPVAFRLPSTREVADRLDAADGAHNRIGLILDYEDRGDLSGYELAAQSEARRWLRHMPAAGPLVAERSGLEPRALAPLGIAVLVVSLALLVPSRSLTSADLPLVTQTVTEDSGELLDPAPETPVEREPSNPPEVAALTPPSDPPRQGVAPRSGNASATATERPADQSRDRVPASGQPGAGRPVESQRAQQSAASQGDPTEGETSKQAPKPPQSPTKKPKLRDDPTRVVPQERESDQKTGATVGQSGAGGGSMSPVKSPWSQQDRSLDAPLPDVASEQDLEDEVEEDTARGGTQPSMKDRRGATSRDLSISGVGDEPGDGRGGPSRQKKSRGTASLILGVPLPDFVRGQLNPGTTKVTHERVDPVPGEGAPQSAEAVQPRRERELRVPRPQWPAHITNDVQRFLLSLRRADS